MSERRNPVEAAFAAGVFGGAALAAAALGLMGAHLASSQLFPAQEFAAFEETAPDLRDALSSPSLDVRERAVAVARTGKQPVPARKG